MTKHWFSFLQPLKKTNESLQKKIKQILSGWPFQTHFNLHTRTWCMTLHTSALYKNHTMKDWWWCAARYFGTSVGWTRTWTGWSKGQDCEDSIHSYMNGFIKYIHQDAAKLILSRSGWWQDKQCYSTQTRHDKSIFSWTYHYSSLYQPHI